MKEEKETAFSKIMNTIYRLIILNVLTLITIALGLVVLSLIPALSSMYALIKSDYEYSIKDIARRYFKTFFYLFKKGLLLNIFFIIFIFLGVFASYFLYINLQENDVFLLAFLYYIFIFLTALFLLVMINSCLVIVYFPYLNVRRSIVNSFKLTFATLWQNLVIFALLIGLIYISILFIYIPLFILLSFYFYLIFLLLDAPYDRLINKDYGFVNPKDIDIKK